MKKSFILFTVIPVLLLTSCQKSLDKFEDHYSYYSFSSCVDQEQANVIHAGMLLGRTKLSSISTRDEHYWLSMYAESSVVTETEILIKEDSENPDCFIKETKEITNTVTKSDDGVVEEQKEVETIEWDDGTGYFRKITKTTINGEELEKRSSEEIDVSSSEYKEKCLNKTMAIPFRDDRYYLDSDGTYKVIVINSIVVGDIPICLADEVKTESRVHKLQEVITIGKDNTLSEHTYYNELNSDVDHFGTGEWYSSIRLVEREYKVISYHYAEKESASISYYNSL